MNTVIRIAISALLAASASTAMAQGKEDSLSDCVSLGSDYKVARNNGGQYFMLKNGESHYKVAMKGSCSSLATTSQLQIRTQGQENQLCPKDTQVLTKRDICQVANVSNISAETFDKARKRSR